MEINKDNYIKIKYLITIFETSNNIPVIGREGWFYNNDKKSYSCQMLKQMKRIGSQLWYFDGERWFENFSYYK